MKLELYKHWLVEEWVVQDGNPRINAVSSCGTCLYYLKRSKSCKVFDTLVLEHDWHTSLDYEYGCSNYKRDKKRYKRLI